jgi:H(+)-transporting ATP synthase subunit D
MANIPITRQSYLIRTKKIVLAEQAARLLEQKQSVLLLEIRKSADQFLAETTSLAQFCTRTRYAVSHAEAVLGEEDLRYIAISGKRSLPIEISSDTIMGIRIPNIYLSQAITDFPRTYALSNTSMLVDEVVTSARAEIHALVRLANRELRLKRLMEEYQRTFRRLKTIENRIIPRLKREIAWIQLNLEERERTDFYRLKRIKNHQPSRSAM